MKLVTARAPVNIALIKYWGKKNAELITPLNDSLSITLSCEQMFAETTIALSKEFEKDRLWLNDKEENVQNIRIQNCLREVRERARKQHGNKFTEYEGSVHICSRNNFPTAAGMASSAAGYACLVYALSKLFRLEGDVSMIARQGSGSACRSIYGGFVQWLSGVKNDGTDSLAVQVLSPEHWPEMRILICVVSDHKKSTSSTSGMEQTVKTSQLLKHRVKTVVPERMIALKDAIVKKDFNKFSEIVIMESNQLHAVAQDTYPPIRYMNDISWAIVNLIHKYNKFHGINKVAYSFDAGPNAFLFLPEDNVAEVVSVLKHFFPLENGIEKFALGLPLPAPVDLSKDLNEGLDCQITQGGLKNLYYTKIGHGPYVVKNAVHLLNEKGLPN